MQQQYDASQTITDFSASYRDARETEYESVLPESVADCLSQALLNELMVITPQQFAEEYLRKKKSTGIAYVCWLLLGVHYGYTGKWMLQILFWFTAGGLGFWALVDLFRIPRLVKDYNHDIARKLLTDLQSVS